jgi:monoamine oxidase
VAAVVLVLGAGIAGRAAAERLAAAGRRVLILEARDRLGGRILTVAHPSLGHPIELGAEFVHGRPAALIGLIRALGLTLESMPERHRRGRGHAPTPLPDIRQTLGLLLHPAGDPPPDVPAADLLRQRRAELPRVEGLEAVARYLEGFHAADLDRLGTLSLAENEAAEDEDGDDPHRVRESYGALVQRLAERLDPDRVEIRLESIVTSLQWRAGEVRVMVRTAAGTATETTAPRAIVTLPLPALTGRPQAPGAVAIDPEPPGWRPALGALHMGHAQHVVLGFDARWWTSQDEDGPSFVHGDAEPFPVWWSALPSRQALLTGWVGGPRAAALAGRSEEEVRRLALDSVASVFGHDVAEVRARLRLAYWHDWSSDLFAGGAYSYGGVGAIEARRTLARPVDGTLFLAGEAMAQHGRNATVHGALISGWEAAAALLAQL